jgi:hypothetical protein
MGSGIWTNEWMKVEESNGMFPGSDGLMIFLVVGVTNSCIFRVPSRVVGAAGILRFIDMIVDGEIASCPSNGPSSHIACIDLLTDPTVNAAKDRHTSVPTYWAM